MNKLKGYVIYSKDQHKALSDFLKRADGCEYMPVAAIDEGIIRSLDDISTVFDVNTALKTLNRYVTHKEVATTLSHIQCWKLVVSDNSIQDDDFVLISEPDVIFHPNYFSALTHHIETFLYNTKYEAALLHRASEPTWDNDNAYAGTGEVSSIVYSLAKAYDEAASQCYLIRKRTLKMVLQSLNTKKPSWLASQISQFCDFNLIVQLNKALAYSAQHKAIKLSYPKQPLFSVIMPAWNTADYIKQALDSILSQTYTNYELIIINDGSTDKTDDICLEYSKQYKNIIFISKDNCGVSSARNTALSIARGEYIVFADSDDYWRHNHILSDFAQIISEKDVDLILTSNVMIYDRKEIDELCEAEEKHLLDVQSQLSGNFEHDFLTLIENNIYNGACHNKSIKRSLIVEANLSFPVSIQNAEDVLWCYELSKLIKNYELYTTPFNLCIKGRPGSITTYISPEKYDDMLFIFNKCNNDFRLNMKSSPLFDGFVRYLSPLVNKIIGDFDLLTKEEQEKRIHILEKFKEQFKGQY